MPDTRTGPEIHGHRGARGHRPENTLAAVQYALDLGIDGIEIDLCVTADDELVLHHDLCLNTYATRDQSGNWIEGEIPVYSLPLDELQRYDVGRLKPGSHGAERFNLQVPVDGSPAPTLEQCVQVMRNHPGEMPVLNIELKGHPPFPGLSPHPAHFVNLLLHKIDELQLANELFIQSFDWRLMHEIHDRRSDLRTGLLTDQHPDHPQDIHLYVDEDNPISGMEIASHPLSVPQLVRENEGDVWSCHFVDLTRESLQQARDLGLGVYVWTVNEDEDILRMADWGVDVITSDYPDRCLELLGRT